MPVSTKAIAIADIKLTRQSPIFANLDNPVIAEHPLCFEDLDQGYGFVLYRTTLKSAVRGLLKIKELRDYATVYLNGKRISVLDRRLKQDSVELRVAEPNTILDILVENNGRINYGPYLTDNCQGITEKVTLAGTELSNWKMYKLPFTTTAGFIYTTNKDIDDLASTLYKGIFSLTKTGDTYLDMQGFGKGFVFLNGRNLGKYWEIGPQQTLYVPAAWLKKGVNQVVVFDELKNGHTKISALDHPILNLNLIK